MEDPSAWRARPDRASISVGGADMQAVFHRRPQTVRLLIVGRPAASGDQRRMVACALEVLIPC